MSEQRTYSKILVARHSPKNQCNAEDGEPLIVIPKASVPVKTVAEHFFVGGRSGKKSRFGWVVHVDTPFTLDSFLLEHAGKKSNDLTRAATLRLLDAIQPLEPETPVACDYRKAGLSSEMSLWIHRVAFYKG